ncbi:MAG: saccharopine dehydrogenase NADP-binding domain-containing protein, partial [Calditrichaeota bacterium]|nr:saccharopine dehydrogenase NADP-binding domain-containing protein [Calditrichota bacterium]
MKHILILGAGQSTPYLINYLLNQAEEHDWFVTVGDLDIASAQKAINNHPRGNAIQFDINDQAMRATHFEKADLVVNMLSPVFQQLVGLECLNHTADMITASYENPGIRDLNPDLNRKGLIFLNEMGLDPGIDHMSAMKMIHYVQDKGGVITGFLSYGSGVPAPEVQSNPLRYCITWNPRNVVRAGEVGAQYMEEGKVKVLSYHHVFNRTWAVEVNGVGTM